MQEPKPNYDINPGQRIPCVLVIDASASISGRPIKELNKGLKVLEQELKIQSHLQEYRLPAYPLEAKHQGQ